MEQTAQARIDAATQRRRRNKKFAGAVLLLSLVVAGGVFWQLHRTGYALTDQPGCGIEEHIHTQDCLAMELVCQIDTETPHVHDSACYTQEWVNCALPEHLHGEGCFEEERELICPEPEHQHREDCYARRLSCQEQEHIHEDCCYQWVEVLACGNQEHSHSEECYGQILSVTCGQQEHLHTEECYREEAVLECTAAEHTHGDGCYEMTQVLTCTAGAHTHGESCYELSSELICTEDHSHTQECYQEQRRLVCTEEEHTHGDGCYEQRLNLICQEPEHIHGTDCYRLEQVLECSQEEHLHTEECMSQEWGLICGEQEHTHDEQCQERRQELVCTEAEHSHSDQCYEGEPELICTETEHIHGEDCYAPILELDCLLEEGSHTHSESCYIERICGREVGTDHMHTAECYAVRENLVCGLEEGQIHTHTQDCYRVKMKQVCDQTEHLHSADCQELQEVLSCTLAEGALHVHDESCYVPQRELCCELEHPHEEDCYRYVHSCGMEEHQHSELCYPDPAADVETPEIWEKTLPESYCGNWMQDVVAIAQSQLGYAESERNYVLDDSGLRRGYTRYGAWYGNSYGNWDAMFAAFCLNYAGVPQEEMPYNGGAHAWLVELENMGYAYTLEENDPYPGYLVFLDTDGDGTADLVGIIESAEEDLLSVICGNLTDEEGVDRVGRLTMDFQDSRILAFSIIPFQEQVALLNEVKKVLESDDAYIADAYLVADNTTDSGFAIRTGTTPWDANSTEPGLDKTDQDNVVRSFDSINYTMELKPCTRGTQDYYREGWVYYEFLLNCTETEGYFDTGSMTWLDSNNMELTTGTYNDETVQILRGKVYLTTPETGEDGIPNAPVFGNTLKEFTCNIQVLAAANGKKLQPRFTFWTDYNTVPTDGLVTGSGTVCETHNEVEHKTIESPVITVTAAPRFNVALTSLSAGVYGVVDYYDFSTGNEIACNRDAGVVYGRQAMMGISVQMYGDKDRGLKGCEVPNGEPITFTFTLSNTYTNEDGEEYALTDTYTPLVWSYEGNAENRNPALVSADGRKVNISDGNTWFSAHTSIPYNTYDPNYTESPYNTYRKCHNGGTWSMIQTGNKVSVTIKGYEVSPFVFPSCDPSMWNMETTHGTYYDPQSQNPWMAWPAFFSTGEVWIVQPFNAVAAGNTVMADGTVVEDHTVGKGDYVVNQYGSGTFTTNVVEGNMSITTISGQSAATEKSDGQRVTTDDARNTTIHLTQPGRISSEIRYTTNVKTNNPLTDYCDGTGRDWAFQGNGLGIGTRFGQYEADPTNEIFAMDMLIKFDDAFFVPNGSKYWDDGRILFAAKKDGTGWNHKGLKPEEEGYDDEMRSAQIEDLIYFNSLSELWNQGYTCVGAIRQYRGELNGLKAEVDFRIGGTVSENADVGSVYMTTFEHRGWIKAGSAQAVANYVNKSIGELTDDDYKNYVTNEFPNVSGDGVTVDYSTYPEASYVYGYNNIAAMQNYEKVSYDESGVTSGSAGNNAADSCLVVSVISEIGKSIVQQQSNGAAKQTFDMDGRQRVVDYVLTTKLRRPAGISTTSTAEYTTTVYVEDTLPASLTYISGSSYWGGTYNQTGEGKQGIITDGKRLEPDITENEDGTTTLRWKYSVTMTNETEQTFGPIYFSCDIGKPGEEGDVQDNQDVNNTARIWTDDDKRSCDPALCNGNVASTSFKVKKLTQVSIVKFADQPIVETGEDVGFKLVVTNGSANPRDVKIVDVLPYAGDGDSTFTGVSYVTEMTDETILEGFTFYYTLEESYRGKAAVDYSNLDFTEGSGWKKWDRNEDGAFTLPSENFSPVAIAVSGTVPANKTMRIHIVTRQPDALPGEKVVNRMYSEGFEIPADSVYAASLQIRKVAMENEEALTGAVFSMEYQVPGEQEYKQAYFELQEDGKYHFSAAQTSTTVSGLSVGEDGKLLLAGLPYKTWRLTETQAPEGYSGLKNPVTITFGKGETEDGQTQIIPTVSTDQEPEGGRERVTGEGGTVVVRNDKTYALPMTGGIGTALFYWIGAILMIGAAIVLRSRMRQFA